MVSRLCRGTLVGVARISSLMNLSTSLLSR